MSMLTRHGIPTDVIETTDERYHVKQLLAASDYRFIDVGRDTLAVRFESVKAA